MGALAIACLLQTYRVHDYQRRLDALDANLEVERHVVQTMADAAIALDECMRQLSECKEANERLQAEVRLLRGVDTQPLLVLPKPLRVETQESFK